ncbi:MAG: carboxypeptidase M32 [Candidatus Izemoplasmatales bacterium]
MKLELVKEFREIVKKIKAYNYVMSLVGWDSATEAPKGSFPRRAEMMGILSAESFRLQTGEHTVSVVNQLFEQKESLDPLLKREIEKAKKNIDKVVKIPEEDYVAYQKLAQISENIWEEAKDKEDYELFKPYLKQIIDYTKKFVNYYEIDDLPYNVLLDEYEEGMTMKEFDEFFDTLRKDLVPFVKEVLNVKKQENDAFMTAFFDKKKQEEFCDYLIDVVAFNRNYGLMKKSVHPFTWNTSPEDVRFTTRYLENYMFSSIFAAIHELGHGTYEQQISTEFDDTLLNGGTSMGIHESQSRFFENMIGRSYSFWKTHYPKLQSIFKEELKDVSLEDFYKAANKVEASFIRVEADELTYPMHIMLRYDLEKQLIDGSLTVDELPAAWDDLMVAYLGIRPTKMSEGVLQDVHWSGGMIGYFPTYVLGSAYAAQFYYTMKKDLDIESLIEQGEIKQINAWLREKIHKYGSSKSPKELLLDVTGEPFNAMYYVKYLKEKYSALYLK